MFESVSAAFRREADCPLPAQFPSLNAFGNREPPLGHSWAFRAAKKLDVTGDLEAHPIKRRFQGLSH